MRIAPLAATCAILTLAVAALAGQATDVSAAGIQGDANCDQKVTTIDAFAVLHTTAGLATAPCIYNGDVDCDSNYTQRDVLRIMWHVVGYPRPNITGCPPVGSAVDITPTPSGTPVVSPPPAPTNSPTPTATQAPTLSPTPTATAQPPTATPTSTSTASASRTPTPSPGATPKTGVEPQCDVFPADNWWNDDISTYPVHANSNAIVDRIGRWEYAHPDFGTVWENKPIGIPYVIVGNGQPKVPISFYYGQESDPGPYPIPPNVPVEGQPVGQPNTGNFGGDRHVLVIDESTCFLYETFDSHPVNGGASWTAGSGAIWDLNSNDLRPETWTSADAAGLPIFAGLVRYSEVVEEGVIDHALRFTVDDSRMAYIHPATHWASDLTATNLPPMGMRFRMKASYNCSWASTEIQVVCTALKKYGMFVADNGADWYISGAPDPRWDDDRLGDLKDIPGDAFEVVETGEPVVTP